MKNYFRIGSYFKGTTSTLILFFSLSTNFCFAQSGLNKTQEELIAFVNRPAYSALYSEVSIEEKSIVAFSKDLKKGVYYSFNSYNRCTREVMSEKLENNNYDSILKFFKNYLTALNYELVPNTDNSYQNSRERINAIIEKNDGWLNIVFKKF